MPPVSTAQHSTARAGQHAQQQHAGQHMLRSESCRRAGVDDNRALPTGGAGASVGAVGAALLRHCNRHAGLTTRSR
jgi:hypothetical protein